MMNHIELVNGQHSFFDDANNNDLVTWNKESQFAIQALTGNNHLMKIAMNNQASFQNALINVAAIGISLNPALKHAYLVPRGNQVVLDVSYQGLIHLATQSGAILWGQAKLVYENDDYENIGIDKAPNHKQKTFGEKGQIVGVYCTVKTTSGDFLTEEMDIVAIQRVQQASKASNGPWKNWWDEMARKTVVKRASKYWPKTESLSTAIETINEHEGIEEKEIVDHYQLLCNEHRDSINAVKEGIASNDLSYAAEAWYELGSDLNEDLWRSPKAGGCFTTQERKVISSTEFRQAHNWSN